MVFSKFVPRFDTDDERYLVATASDFPCITIDEAEALVSQNRSLFEKFANNNRLLSALNSVLLRYLQAKLRRPCPPSRGRSGKYECLRKCGWKCDRFYEWQRHLAERYCPHRVIFCLLCGYCCSREEHFRLHLHARHVSLENIVRDALIRSSEFSINFNISCGFCTAHTPVFHDFHEFTDHVAIHFQQGHSVDSWLETDYQVIGVRSSELEQCLANHLSDANSIDGSVSCATSSVFSIASGASSQSSMVSETSLEHLAATEKFFDFLMKDMDFVHSCTEAPVRIHPERFQRNLIRLFRAYAVELKGIANSPLEHIARRQVFWRAPYLSSKVKNSFYPHLEAQDRVMELDSLHSLDQIGGEDIEEDVDQHDEQGHPDADLAEPTKFEEVKVFLVEGKPFQNFQQKFRRFVTQKQDKSTSLLNESNESYIDSPDDGITAETPVAVPNDLVNQQQDETESEDSSLGSDQFNPYDYSTEVEALLGIDPRPEISRSHYLSRISAVLKSIWRQEQPRLQQGMMRIEFNCKCGKRIYDDYRELKPGDLDKWQTYLSAAYSDGLTAAANPSNLLPRQPTRLLGSPGPSISRSVPSANSQQQSILPMHQISRSSPAPVSPTRGSRSTIDGRWLILCYPNSKHSIKAYHHDMSLYVLDRPFFESLRSEYFQIKGFFRYWLSLMTVTSIRYVQFEIDENEEVEITKIPDLPPSGNDDYEVLRTRCPPVGPNKLLHWFESPDCALPNGRAIATLPKKRGAKLIACPASGFSLGWGLEFKEGLSEKKTFVVTLIVLIVSGAFSVVWSIAKKDISGGFTVGAYMMLLCTAIMGVAHTSV